MAQTSAFDPMTQIKCVLTARCLMLLIGLLASTKKMVPEGRLHMRPFQFHLKEHWIFPQSLDTLLPWRETISAHLDWWQNPTNVMKGSDLHPKDHSIQLFTDASNEGWGAHVEQTSAKGLWSNGKKATHKCSRAEGVFSGLSKVPGPVSEPNSVSCHRKLNSGSLHKQTRRKPLSGDVCSPVEDHDLVPSLPDNTQSQTHSRVSECDGRPAIQVEPSSVNTMVTASAGMKGADLHPNDHSIKFFTDASNEGWGAHLEQTSAKGLWLNREKRLHINVLELKAVSLAFQRFKDQCQNQTVLVATENSTVVAYINKQGGTHSAEMCALLWKIMTWCHHYQITLKARHIPGCLNVMADLLSRWNQVQSTEHTEIHAWVANKVSNLGQWEKVALFPSSDFIAKNH